MISGAMGTILVICVVIIALTNLFIALIIGLVLLRISNVLFQLEKFVRALNNFTTSSTGIFGTVIGVIASMLSRKNKGGC
ncbi:MAG: hypothetical protein KKH91_05425 [Elusimicrobia bacterium]|nr:hypothetical protein [Elusimicrobiota bacterium]MBU2614468.1 hypothetical protein [Elusimicrobiota bacterium]